MNNPNDAIKPVHIKSNGTVKSILWFDPVTNEVKMDPMHVGDLSLRDFTRIHAFFRKVQGLKFSILQGGPVGTFEELRAGQVFRTSLYPNATFWKNGDGGEIRTGDVPMEDGRHYLRAGIVAMKKDTPVETI